MRCFGTCWDFKDDVPLNEIGLLEIDPGASDTYLLLITDQRAVPSTILYDAWDEWWRTRYSDEPEDRDRRLPEDVPLDWPP